MWGFLAGGLVWFGVPFCFASTMGLAYLALSAHAGQPLLSDADVNRGKRQHTNRAGLDWGELDWTGLGWTGLAWTGLG